MYEINKERHEMPESHSTRKKYPFRSMAVGDSFDVPVNGRDIKKMRHTISASSSQMRFGDARFVTRYLKDLDIIRVWRVE